MNDEAGIARARWREERRAVCMIEGGRKGGYGWLQDYRVIRERKEREYQY